MFNLWGFLQNTALSINSPLSSILRCNSKFGVNTVTPPHLKMSKMFFTVIDVLIVVDYYPTQIESKERGHWLFICRFDLSWHRYIPRWQCPEGRSMGASRGIPGIWLQTSLQCSTNSPQFIAHCCVQNTLLRSNIKESHLHTNTQVVIRVVHKRDVGICGACRGVDPAPGQDTALTLRCRLIPFCDCTCWTRSFWRWRKQKAVHRWAASCRRKLAASWNFIQLLGERHFFGAP